MLLGLGLLDGRAPMTQMHFMMLLPMPLVGIGLILDHLRRSIERRAQYYTLTNRRAFIGEAACFTRNLASYSLTADIPLMLVPGPPDSVYFALQVRAGEMERVGFQRLEDGREVYGLIRDLTGPHLAEGGPSR